MIGLLPVLVQVAEGVEDGDAHGFTDIRYPRPAVVFRAALVRIDIRPLFVRKPCHIHAQVLCSKQEASGQRILISRVNTQVFLCLIKRY